MRNEMPRLFSPNGVWLRLAATRTTASTCSYVLNARRRLYSEYIADRKKFRSISMSLPSIQLRCIMVAASASISNPAEKRRRRLQMPTSWNENVRNHVANAIRLFLLTKKAQYLQRACQLGDADELLASIYLNVANSESASRILASAKTDDIYRFILFVAKRKLYSMARRNSVQQGREAQLVNQEMLEKVYLVPSKNTSARWRLNSLCRMLPLRQKKVVILKKRGMTNREIANRLKVSERTVGRDWQSICHLLKARAAEN